MELEDEEGLCAFEEGKSVDDDQFADDDEDQPVEEESHPFDDDVQPLAEDNQLFEGEVRLFKKEPLPLEEDAHPLEEDTHPLDEDTHPLDEETQHPEEESFQEALPPEPVIIKKKRGKKKKPPVEEVFLPLPEGAVEGFCPEIVEELQYAYNILQTIMGIQLIQPFIDKPNENLFGMSSYYNIIRKPMWLSEVRRKLMSKEYDSIAGFVADIRLILENCYRFWGPTHKFSRKALFIEHKLELKLSSLPESVMEKCSEPELNAHEVEIKTEIDDEYPEEARLQENSRESVTIRLNKGFESKILNRVLESGEGGDSEDIEEQNRREEEMLAWEREHLVSDSDREQIKSMWQLAQIGTFLKLTCEVLNVEEITQYEVERMLLMPKESTTLATLMTSMLSPQVLRSQLDFKAVMPYEIWTFRLKRRIDYWFHEYYASDEFQAFINCGVEPAFWTFINITNPLDSAGFHEISFLQRVWIFKTLCDSLMQSDKPIQDCFLNGSAKELRPICVGRDKRRNIYFRIPFFQEVRIYKQSYLPENTFNAVYKGNFYDEFLSEYLEATNSINFNEDEQELEFTPSLKDCVMIADNADSLAIFTKQLKDRKRFLLAKNFSNQLNLVKSERKSIDGLIALHTQWHEYQNRSQEYFSHLLTLWLSAEKHKHRHVDYFNSGSGDDKNEEVLGKRRRKHNANLDFLNFKASDESNEFQSSEDESSDVSDWESTYRNKKKKKQDHMKKRRKQASSESNVSDQEEPCNEESNSTLSILGVQSMHDEFFEVEEKPNINEICIKQEFIKQENGGDICENTTLAIPGSVTTKTLTNYLSSVPTPPVSETSSPSVPSIPVIKREKDDVICISSDEEEESGKPAPNPGDTVIRNGLPPPTQVSVIVPVPVAVVAPVAVPVPVPAAQQVSTPPRRTSIPLPIPIQPVPQPMAVPQLRPLAPGSMGIRPPVPQPIGMPQPIMATPSKKGPPPKRRMPLPMPEPSWPQPIMEPSMPPPISQGWPSPRTPTSVVPPRTRLTSPRLRSPLSSPLGNPVMRTPSPRGSPLNSPLRSALSPLRSPLRPPVRNPAVRNLFPPSSVHTVEGVLGVGQKPDGSYGYHVTLPDGGIINMNRQEIDEIRRKNNGVLPVKIEVPLTKNKKF